MTPLREAEFSVNIDRRNNPPMPLEEFERQAWQSTGKRVAITGFAMLGFYAIVYPYAHRMVNYLIVAGLVVLASIGMAWISRRAQ